MASDIVPSNLSFHQRKKFLNDVKKIFWDEPYLCRSCDNGLILRGVQEVEMLSVLEAFQSSPVGGHNSCIHTVHKFCSVGTIRKPFTKILMSLPSHVIGAK